MKRLTTLLSILAIGFTFSMANAAETHSMTKEKAPMSKMEHSKSMKTVKGEIVDLMCYLDHGAKGKKHASCAEKCIKMGGPVGLLTKSGKLYLVIGDHKPANDMLVDYAGKQVTLKGKVRSKDGMHLLENVEIVK